MTKLITYHAKVSFHSFLLYLSALFWQWTRSVACRKSLLLFIHLHGRVSSQIIEPWRSVINLASYHVDLMCYYSEYGNETRRLINISHKPHNLTWSWSSYILFRYSQTISLKTHLNIVIKPLIFAFLQEYFPPKFSTHSHFPSDIQYSHSMKRHDKHKGAISF